ncbi:MAG: tRNA (adenosine(37)-N6)-threonylcarbamoyltransferase complex ATPase subunit type 1 TsaE [Candidatus Wildermuthbacteria bacterium RIFCSPLOWO2_02_FULL_47_9c]|uniref:tRNA threonylcarbamoyladenosine biosynthesis protein TsaE n=2 Tax=Parcubacteria group TaxID=1794811 RepID=A0A837IM49_9BACT|nr:MAG: hypothetical protein UY25_C0001G0076 [Candidatus Yanofskybacteria bacterium GW2011_GWC1_48_11]KKW03950.1 MAG: hypothetical protein UY38_C0002G0104 [Parcubacteria group bacterium GW2011_GWB1_49_12]KKW08704.1 MAG: hypothetical protein UY45_C0004G0034 [Parcubacteria group bacterium GW2011_GWA1_49_26]OHA61653.1 MAG: tRNA (adenosine(37)-N6)-threonylcarbamoyltransferase complex ATPase subunit type 1 TsaE [Candidatus Wildermuthbacteria bacterium GWA1_49_26]OHA65371.1 MAG: tRNA (adenosine(37)-N
MKKSTTKIETRSSEETKKVARQFVKQLFEKQPKAERARVIALQGELGSGKTTFIQSVARGLGIKEKVLSPTFVIVKSYSLSRAAYGIRNLYHVDCYRLKGPKELKELGWDSIVSDPRNLILIEWPERILKILPEDITILKFLIKGEKEREIAIWRKNGKYSSL